MIRSRNTEHGFSLIELISALGISGIILGAITATLISQSRSYDAQEQINGMQQAARVAMDMITREVRMAGYNPTGAIFVGFHHHNDKIHIRADLDGDGTADDANENIYYTYDATQRIIERDDRDGTGIETLVENIEGPGGASGFTLVFLDKDGLATTTDADIRQIQVTITAKTAKSDPNYTSNGGYRTFTLTSLITPRNLAY